MAGILLTSDGVIASDAIEQHARAFTLDYLRHSILGTPREFPGEPLHGPRLITNEPSGLILTPYEKECAEYAPAQKTPESASSQPKLVDGGLPLKRVQKHLERATAAGFVSSQMELLRTAIALQMELVLDAAGANDSKKFDEASHALECTMTAGIQNVLGDLMHAGMTEADATLSAKELTENSIKAAIDRRVQSLNDKVSGEALCSNYERLLAAYHEKQEAFQKAVKEQRRAHVPTTRIQRYFIPRHPALVISQAHWRGKNLMPHKGTLERADNDNQPAR